MIEGLTQVSRSAEDPAGTDDPATFRRARYGVDFTYVFTLPPGRYEVELGFCEDFARRAGQRVFDVFANEARIAEKLDIFAAAGGPKRALLKKAEVEVGKDGRLALRFKSERENACVSRIVLRGAGREMIVRCGLESKPPGQAVVGFNIANLLEDERAERLFEEAAAFEREAKYSDALSRYEQILARYGEHLHAVAPGLYVPAGDSALERMARLPEGGLRLYRTLYNDKARGLYEKAAAAGDAAALLEVARAYFPTDSGDDALFAAAKIQLAAGRYEEAAAGLEKLLGEHPAVSVPRAEAVARLAVAYRKLGRARELAALAADAKKSLSGAKFRLGGAETELAAFLDEEVPRLAPRRPAAGGALAAAGWEPAADWQLRIAPFAAVPELVWRAAIPGAQALAGAAAAPELPSFAACSDGAVYVAGPDGADAFWLLSGDLRWSYRSFGHSGAQLHAPAVSGGRVFISRPRFVPRGQEYKYIGERLVALDEAGGRRLWGEDGRAPAGEFDYLLAPNLRSPAAAAGELLLTFTEMEEIKYWRRWSAHPTLCALNPATGRIAWERRIASALPRDRILGVYVPSSAVTVSGGVAYVLTNVGAAAAIETGSGRIRWVRKYTQLPSANDPLRPPPADQRWALGAPLVAQGMVVLAPADGEELLGLRADSGRLAWARERRAGRALLGAEGDRLLAVTAERVQALDLFTGEELWARPLPSPPFGRGAVADGVVYVPTRTGIWRAQCADGAEEPFMPLKDASYSGNLAAVRTEVGTVVLTCSDTHLNVYYDREAALGRLAVLAGSAAGAAEHAAAELAQAEVLAAGGAAPPGKVEALYRAVLAGAPEDARRAGVPLRRIAGSRLLRSLGARAERAAAAGRPAEALQIWDEAAAGSAAGSEEWVAAQIGRLRALAALGRGAEAVAAYQDLIARAPGVPVEVEPGLVMSAGEHAFLRIGALRGRPSGRDPYAAFEAQAGELAKADAAEAAARLAREFPNSRFAAAALLRLAEAAGEDRGARLRAWSQLAAHHPGTEEARQAVAAFQPCPGVDAGFMEWGAVTYTASRPPKLPAAPGVRFEPPFEVLWRVEAPDDDTDQVVLPAAAPGQGEAGALVFIARRQPRAPGVAVLECRRAKDGQLAWKQEVSTTSGGEGGMEEAVFTGGRLVAALGAELYGFDPADDGRHWHLAAPDRVGNLRGAGEVVVFTAGEWLFAAEAPTGRELWRRPLNGMVYMGPAISRGRVSLVLRHPDAIETYDLATGDFVLRRSLSGLYQEYYAARPTFAADGATGVLVHGRDGPALEIYDLLTGTLRGRDPAWLTPNGGGGGQFMFLTGGVNKGPSAVGVFDLRTGKPLWQTPGGGGWAALADGVLYANSRAYDAGSGKPLWSAPAGVGGATHCLIGDRCLVFNCAERGGERWSSRIVILDRKNGNRLESFDLKTRKLGRSPRGYGGTTLWLAGDVLVAATSPEVVGIAGKAP